MLNWLNLLKLLGVCFFDKLNFDKHIEFILTQCSQRVYLMKLLRDQGLSDKHLDVVFQSIIISRLCYALSTWGEFLKGKQINRVNAFCHRSVKYHITTHLFNFQEMLDQVDNSLFKKITLSCNCLHSTFPELVNNIHNTRKRGHPYKLNRVITGLYRCSFLPRCLFAYV